MENSSGPILYCTNRSFDLWYVHTGSGLGEYDLGTPKNKNEILARLAQYTILRTHPQVVEEDEDEKDDEDDEDDEDNEDDISYCKLLHVANVLSVRRLCKCICACLLQIKRASVVQMYMCVFVANVLF